MVSLELGDVNSTLGAVEIGVLVSVMLFGVSTVQTYHYFRRFPNDIRVIRFSVLFLWLLELGHTISICDTLYRLTISAYGKSWTLLDSLPQSLNVAVLLSGFIGPMEQTWFAYRIYKFSGRSIWLPFFCVVLSLLRLGGSFGIAIIGIQGPDLLTYQRRASWLLVAVLSLGAFTDLVLAVALCYYLVQRRGDGFQRTNRIVDKIMIWAIETGVMTSIGAFAVLITSVVASHTFVWIGLFTILARLFSNSFLASLNARPRFARLWQEDSSLVQQSIHSSRENPPYSATGRARFHLSRIEVPLSPLKEELTPNHHDKAVSSKLTPLEPVFHAS